MIYWGRAATLLLALSVAACERLPRDVAADKARGEAVLARREARTRMALAQPDSGARDTLALARWLLPNALKEVSGVALTADERLLVHDDTHGRVVEIDYRRGVIVKHFALAPDPGKVDLEGITVAGGSIFLIVSDGTLLEFKEGATGATVPYVKHDTGLGGECEFEGVAFDPAIASLLLACKVVKAAALNNSLVIYRWKLGEGIAPAARLSRLAVSDGAIALKGGKTMNPSDITVDPTSGNYVLISAREKAILEITPAGAVVASRQLTGAHPQPEGVAITKDRILIISDEAASGPAAITLYRRP